MQHVLNVTALARNIMLLKKRMFNVHKTFMPKVGVGELIFRRSGT